MPTITLDGKTFNCILDTGSLKSIVSINFLEKNDWIRKIHFHDMTDLALMFTQQSSAPGQVVAEPKLEAAKVIGKASFYVGFGQNMSPPMNKFKMDFSVMSRATNGIIVGKDCLLKHSEVNQEATYGLFTNFVDKQIHAEYPKFLFGQPVEVEGPGKTKKAGIVDARCDNKVTRTIKIKFSTEFRSLSVDKKYV